MRNKTLFSALILGVVIISLSGCASFKVRAAEQNACVDSPVLYTNLTQPVGIRSYELSNGVGCTSYLEAPNV